MARQRRIEIREIGAEGALAVIVDEFATDPGRWRNEASGREYRSMGDFYPGGRTAVPADYFSDVGPVLGEIFRNVFACTGRMSIQRALYSIASTPREELGLAQRIPHFDETAPGHYAMVHYLSPEDLGGTAFYRHRSTGFESVSVERHRTYLGRLNDDFQAHGEPAPAYICGDTPLFEQTALVEHRYNRAVIYPASLLHCSQLRQGVALDPDPLCGRLTIAAFMLAR
ncbi:MAG: hypothetical protein A3J40_00100 [Erythrobacter sp. RIFCSPHIGHO2_12_FULL_63_10]|nr:MAG: hypothetical protein A3J40_00100 [Erythrobacter sp. RIFCSPHIGHO2_12_FULL_63_10]